MSFPAARDAFRDLEDELSEAVVPRSITTQWNYESLRRARVTLDGTCCRLFQLFWATLDPADVVIFVWIDSSPQWKGQELFAATMDLIIGGMDHFYMRVIFPSNFDIEDYVYGVGKNICFPMVLFLACRSIIPQIAELH